MIFISFDKFSKIAKGFQKVDMGLKKIYKSCQRVTRYQMVVKNSLKKDTIGSKFFERVSAD